MVDDLKVLHHLRSNSRKSMSKLSKEIGVPKSTLYDRLRRYERDFIIKYTTLVDFSALGYPIRVNFVLKTEKQEELENFLREHKNVNSVARINNNHHFLADCVFKNQAELFAFKDNIREYGIQDIQEFHILEEIKKEEVLSHKGE